MQPLGFLSLPERGSTVDTVLTRAVAAADRLDVAGWLDSLG